MQTEKYQSADTAGKIELLKNAKTDATKGMTKEFKEQILNGDDVANSTYEQPSVTNGRLSSSSGKSININDSLDSQNRTILETYQSMDSDEWNSYLNENKTAEYDLAMAQYTNNLANGTLTNAEKVKKNKELKKLGVSKDYDKEIRDAYSLASSKSDMQSYLSMLDDETRATQTEALNSLNRAMYDAGVISASTYKSRSRAINNTSSSSSNRKSSKSSSSSTLSSGAKAAIKALGKSSAEYTLDANKKVSAPNTSRKMSSSGMKSTSTSVKTPSKSKITVKKGIK